jgi:hypothetical protein
MTWFGERLMIQEILAIRKSLWVAVASRLHTVRKVFPFGSESDEVMIYGSVAYTLKDGRKADVGFSAALFRGEKVEGKLIIALG